MFGYRARMSAENPSKTWESGRRLARTARFFGIAFMVIGINVISDHDALSWWGALGISLFIVGLRAFVESCIFDYHHETHH